MSRAACAFRLKTVFVSETDPIRWFYHTVRTEANFLRVLPDSRSRTKAGCDRFSKRRRAGGGGKTFGTLGV